MHCPLSRCSAKNVSDVMLPKLRPCFTLGITHATILQTLHMQYALVAINQPLRNFTGPSPLLKRLQAFYT